MVTTWEYGEDGHPLSWTQELSHLGRWYIHMIVWALCDMGVRMEDRVMTAALIGTDRVSGEV